jgi:hypothetical protein
MCKFSRYEWMVMGVLLAAGGCGSPRTEEPQSSSPSPAAAQKKASQADKMSKGAEPATAGAAEDYQVLTAEDRVAAKKQRICPVTGALLGSMGEPYKVEVKHRTVFLCCQGCAGAILQDPDKYLKKLEKAPAEK